MRSLQFFTATSLSLAAIAVFLGCGPAFVDPFGIGGSTGTSHTTGATGTASNGTGSGTGGEAGVCPGNAIKDNLLANPSFESDSTWVVTGSPVDYLPAADCSFACGDRFGHVAVKAGGGMGDVVVSQALDRKIELGSSFAASAHYTSTSASAPYFGLIVNGYSLGGINGVQSSNHLSIDNVAVPIQDPRRTGVGVTYNMNAGYDDKGMEATFDCFALTYVAPAGVELLTNGWFDANTTEWTGTSSAALSWEDQNGICGATTGAAHVKVPASSPDANLRGTVKGSWAAGTKFRFGGAVRGVDINAPLTGYSLTLHLVYKDDGNGATQDFFDVPVPMDLGTTEPWKPAVGEGTATRPVVQVDLVQKSGDAAKEQDYLGDCYSLRAITAP